MKRYLPIFATFSIAAFALTSQPARAEWANARWVLNEEISFVNCYGFCSKEQIADNAARRPLVESMAAKVKPELDAISEWMSSMSFAQARVPTTPGEFFVFPLRGMSAENLKLLGGSVASFTPNAGMELSDAAFIAPLAADGSYSRAQEIENSTTLAHELYHGVQAALRPPESDPTWFSESMPEAVGRAWAYKRHGQLEFNPQNYEEPLHEPGNPYNRDHFFYMLGQDLNAKPRVAYFVDLEKETGRDGAGGLIWIDTFLASRNRTSLAAYYPQFIARHADSAKSFGENAKARSDAKQFSPQTKIAAGETGAVARDTEPRSIAKVAAIYTDSGPEFTGDWGTVDDDQRIFVNLLSLYKADRPDDARLIVGPKVIEPGERHVASVYAMTGKTTKPMIVRVSNVARIAQDSAPQAVTLELQTQQVTFGLPACLQAGKTAQITIEGPLTAEENAKMFSTGPSRLRASAGKIDGSFMFTAPGTAQKVTISLSLTDPMGKSHRVKLPSIDITSGGCMVRMTAGDNDMTYVPDGDYSEANVRREGVAMYLKENDIALYRGGWQNIPAQGKAMMVGMMNKTMMVGVPSFFDDGHPEKGNMEAWKTHRMPKIIAERFAWHNLRNAKGPNGSPPTRKAAPCPNGGSGCSATTIVAEGNTVSITFDDAQRAIQVSQNGTLVTFGYDGYDVRRPPGW